MVESPKIQQQQQQQKQQGPRVVAVTKRKRDTNNNNIEKQQPDGMVKLSPKQNHNNNNNNNNNNSSATPNNNISTPQQKRVSSMPAIVYSMDSFGNIQITSGSATPKIKPKTTNDPSLDKSLKANDLVLKSSTKNNLVPSTSSSPSLSPTSPGEGTFHLIEHISDREEEEVDGSASYLDNLQQQQQLHQQQPQQTHSSIPTITKVTRTNMSEVEYQNGHIKRPDNLVIRTNNLHKLTPDISQQPPEHNVIVEKTQEHKLNTSQHQQSSDHHKVTVEKTNQQKPSTPQNLPSDHTVTVEKTQKHKLVDETELKKTKQRCKPPEIAEDELINKNTDDDDDDNPYEDLDDTVRESTSSEEHLNSRGHRPPPVLPKPSKEDIRLLLERRHSSELVDENGDPLYAPITKTTKSSKLSHVETPKPNNDTSPKLPASNNASPITDKFVTSLATKEEEDVTLAAQTQIANTITTSDLVDENGDALYAPVIKTHSKRDNNSISPSDSTQSKTTKSTTSEVSVFSDSGFSSDVSPVDPFVDEPIYATPERSPTETTPSK